MSSTPSSSSGVAGNDAEELTTFIQSIAHDPEREAVASEIEGKGIH
jgi:hypothetical protein